MPPDFEWDIDRQNAAIYAQYKEMPLAEVMTFSSQHIRRPSSGRRAVPEEDIASTGAQTWTEDKTLLGNRSRPVLRTLRATCRRARSISGDEIP